MSERNQTATAPAGYDIQTMSDEQLRTVGMIRISKAAAICREQGRHWDSDAVIIDRNYADYCADLIEAGAPAQGQQVGQEPVYVECRECAGCGHVGINDSLETHSACDRCAWIGRSPAEDKCPGCAYENTMSAACPKCGCIYRLLADAEITTPQPAPAQDVAGLVDLLERVKLTDEEARHHHQCGATYWNNAVLACQVAIRDALAAAPTVKAGQVQCVTPTGNTYPSLPAAGSAEEELWAVHAQGPDDLYPAFSRDDADTHAAALNSLPMQEGISVSAVVVPSPWPAVEHWKYLAEQERDHVAALSAQQSAHVSVPRELLEDVRRAMFAVLNQEPRMKAVAKRVLNAEIARIDRALLNGGEA